MDLAIETRNENGIRHIVLRGEFDLAAVPAFEDRIAKAESESPSVILIDLTALEFMDSSGLRALVSADDRARRAERRLAIVPGPPAVRRVFEITQLDQRLDLVEDASSVSVSR